MQDFVRLVEVCTLEWLLVIIEVLTHYLFIVDYAAHGSYGQGKSGKVRENY